jgi:hypothetical protein
VDKDGNELNTKDLRALGYQRIEELTKNPFDNAVEGEVDYCNVCQTCVPTEDGCRHICDSYDGNGRSLGTGANDLDVQETKRCMIRFFEWIPKEALELLAEVITHQSFSGLQHSDSILGGDCRYDFRSEAGWVWLYLEPLADDGDVDKRYRPAIAWLYSLDDKTRMQNYLTAGWIWEYCNGKCRPSVVSVEIVEMPIPLIECELGERPEYTLQVTSNQLGQYREAKLFRAEPNDIDQVHVHNNLIYRTFTITEVWEESSGVWSLRLGVCVQRDQKTLSEQHPRKVATSWMINKRKAKRCKS